MLDREERLMSLVRATLRTPSGQRETYLRAACHQDQELYSEVSEIVEWEERMGDFMRDPLVGLIDLEALDRPFKPDQLVADRFEIIREVGDGGMGVVYEAYDRKRQQRIAIKCAKLGYERLSPELRGALKVRHPNVCLVNEIHTASTDLGELDFLTMEFLDGETLLRRLSRGKLEHAESLKFARQLCAGLAEAHRCGVLHRDLKPANIILSPGKNKELRAVITDFGLAADQDGNTDLIGGTPSYMAPELMRDGIASPASDIYALGVILHEMVTGSKPFAEAADNNQHSQLPAVSRKLLRKLPRIWADAIRPCLAPLPEKRHSAEQILAVLDRKPIYRRSWVAIAALIVLTAGAFLWQPIYEYLRPADISLAIISVQGTGDLGSLGEDVLHKVAERLGREPKGKTKFRLIPLATVQNKGVRTPEQAQSLLHATHVLQFELYRYSDGVAAKGAVVDLKSQAHVRDYSGHFSEADLGDLPGGLTGAVTTALHLKYIEAPEAISPDAVAAYKAGRNYLREGRYSFDQAITQFRQAAGVDRHSPLPFAGLAEAYLGKFDIERKKTVLADAKGYLDSAEQLDPDSPQVRIASAGLNIFAGKYAQALDDCRRALEIEPANVDAWLRYGYAYELQGTLDKALDAYHKAMELDPDYYKPYQHLGAFYYYQGKFAEAEPYFRKEVEHGLNDLKGYSDLGAALTEQRKYAEAETAYKTSLQIKKTESNLNNLGAMLAYLGRDADALSLYKRAAELQPASIIYQINIGDSERRLGQAGKAKVAYRKAFTLVSNQLQVNAASGQARSYKAYIEARLGRKDSAMDEIGQALQSSGSDKEVMRRAVLTYEALGQRDLTLQVVKLAPPEVRKAIEVHPDLADLRNDLRYIQVLGNPK